MTTKTAQIHVDPATAYELGEMTPYQDGAVVSRTLLQHETGTLTVFSLLPTIKEQGRFRFPANKWR